MPRLTITAVQPFSVISAGAPAAVGAPMAGRRVSRRSTGPGGRSRLTAQDPQQGAVARAFNYCYDCFQPNPGGNYPC
ncbi:hypothetical protein GCM10010260_26970 [Streptomyces filipinensis]|uniref:Uncharacterized protein n=1 Tax=Streptomyces filipinensis TaxID=66887 RepID=A0A918I9T0_9ACTN|nr:hypothetical protein GCM10010260_26970 [Streptomyces filipinensis]